MIRNVLKAFTWISTYILNSVIAVWAKQKSESEHPKGLNSSRGLNQDPGFMAGPVSIFNLVARKHVVF